MLGTHLSACPCPQAAKIAPRSQLMHSGPAWPPRPHSACHRSGLCCPWLMQIPLLGASPWSPTSHPSGTLSQSQTLVGGLLRLRGLCGCLKPPLHPAPPPPPPSCRLLSILWRFLCPPVHPGAPAVVPVVHVGLCECAGGEGVAQDSAQGVTPPSTPPPTGNSQVHLVML